MSDHLRHALEVELGTTVTGLSRVGGGSINETYEVHLADERRLFCKTHPDAPLDFFRVEAEGLSWLAEPAVIGVPSVLAVRDDPPALLVMEWIELGRADVGHSPVEERLGRELAALHRSGAPGFGWDRDGYIGELGQPNEPAPTWAEFYRHRRLEPLVRTATDLGRLAPEASAAFDRLFSRLGDLVGPSEPPARLHGDLWGGNLLVDRQGRPWLVDPAPYGGHREVDLAMMRLFGGFGRRVFAAYDEAFPLAAGHQDRVPLYQLYPLLVHTVLFGGAYGHQVDQALHRCL